MTLTLCFCYYVRRMMGGTEPDLSWLGEKHLFSLDLSLAVSQQEHGVALLMYVVSF
jgi:hypothetical protein